VICARERAITTIAVTASESGRRPANHSTGQRLADVCDLVVNTCCPVKDALVSIEGWPRPVGGSSTVVASVISHEIITRTAAITASRGRTLPMFVSPTVPGATLESNDEVFEEHRRYLHEAYTRALRAH
jgi:uncharacterized phosphosugar-binding protein